MKWDYWNKPSSGDVVALDIGTEFTKVLQLRFEDSQPLISFAAALPTSELTADWIKMNGLTGQPSVAAFYGESLITEEVELPPMPEDDIADALGWHLNSRTDGRLEDYIIRFSCSDDSSDRKDRIRVMAYAARKDEINETAAFLTKLQLTPQKLEPAVVSLTGAWDYIHQSADAGPLKGTKLFLDLGVRQTHFAVAHEGTLLQARHLEPLGTATAQPYYQWAVAVQNAMDAYSVIYHDHPIDHIFVTGGMGDEGVAPYLTENLGLPAEQLSFNSSILLPLTDDSVAAHSFVIAMGAARPTTGDRE